MEKSIAIFAAINFFIIGISHAVQHNAWREFFTLLHSYGRAGAFLNGMLTLTMGSLIVAFHNVWIGPPMILTLIGWAYLVKSLAIFLKPDWNVHSMAQVQTASKLKLFLAAFALLALSGVIGFSIVVGCYDK